MCGGTQNLLEIGDSTFEKANFLEVAVLGVPQGWGEEGSHGSREREESSSLKRGQKWGVPWAVGTLSSSPYPDRCWELWGIAGCVSGRLEPKHWGTSLSSPKWQRNS